MVWVLHWHGPPWWGPVRPGASSAIVSRRQGCPFVYSSAPIVIQQHFSSTACLSGPRPGRCWATMNKRCGPRLHRDDRLLHRPPHSFSSWYIPWCIPFPFFFAHISSTSPCKTKFRVHFFQETFPDCISSSHRLIEKFLSWKRSQKSSSSILPYNQGHARSGPLKSGPRHITPEWPWVSPNTY